MNSQSNDLPLMMLGNLPSRLAIFAVTLGFGMLQAEEPHTEPKCSAVDHFYTEQVWTKVGERTCSKCHCAEGQDVAVER